MSDAFGSPLVALGTASAAIAVGMLVFLLLSPRRDKVSLHRRRPGAEPEAGALATLSTAATSAVGKAIERRGSGGLPQTLEHAGVRMRQQDFVFLVLVGGLVMAAFGLLFLGPLGLLLGLLAPLLAKVGLDSKTSKRRQKFADQLDDSLQLMSSSLRAGHSLPQALNSVAREAEEPMSEEFSRIINETRVGRDMGEALEDTAQRMGSEDFEWVVQAIGINREVGGNLAEVLDGVGHTIRERNQIRRQVKALSAEGKLSAFILMGLPFVVAFFIFLTNPGYLMGFTERALGYGMLLVAAVLFVIGGIWMRKTVQIKF